MQRYFTILLSYLLLVPAMLLCYAPMKDHFRYGIRKTMLFGACLLTVSIPLCSWIEYRFLTYSNPIFIPFCAVLWIAYMKTLQIHISKSLMIFSTVFTWFSYMNNFAIILDSRIQPDGIIRNDNFIGTFTQLGLSILFTAIMFYPMRKYGGELIATFHDSKVWYTASAVSVLFILVCCFLMPIKYETLYVNHVFRSYIISVSLTFVLHLLLCVIYYFIISGLLHSQKTEEQNKFYEMRESQYLKQQRYIDENKKVRHDFKHTIRTLKELIDKEDCEAVKAYIAQFADTMPENDTIAFCHNPAVNAVLNYYHQLAQESKIMTNWNIDIPDSSPIKNIDLCNIIGNILENAIIACQEIPEEQRWIQFTIKNQHNANLYIVATNSFSGKVKLHNDRYLSTNRDGNGIGLFSIESIAESYRGNANFSHENTEFYTNIVLPMIE